ncbi:MAG TPA: hypothetical protein VKQ72_05290, partial [Aggregatilineales bacterium]|nr:hypothetical protein [Aggregatilineales bacterium]
MISAIFTIVLGWFITFCILAGLGQLVRGIFFRQVASEQNENGFDCFWLGYVAAIALLLILHLVLPVDWKTSLIVAGPGIVGFAGLLRSIRKPIPWRRLAVVLVVLTPVALWFASRALSPQLDFD